MTSIRAKNLLKTSLFSGLVVLGLGTQANAQNKKAPKLVNEDFFGITLDGRQVGPNGGLSAELIPNGSFEVNSGGYAEAWKMVKLEGAEGEIALRSDNPISANNANYLSIHAQDPGKNGLGVRNKGFGEIYVKEGQSYSFSLFAKELQGQSIRIAVRLVNKSGLTIDEERFQTDGANWKQYKGKLTSSITEDGASLEIALSSRGSVGVDVVSLTLSETYKNHGFREDLAQAIADLNPRFIRFVIDGSQSLSTWKNTIGNKEDRSPVVNHTAYDLGLMDYFQFSEDIGAKPMPVLALQGAGEQDASKCVQDVLDLVEFAMGDSRRSTWGKKRAEAGHSKPYDLRYIAVGDNDKLTPEFLEKFEMIYTAMRDKYPNVQVIMNAGAKPEGQDYITARDVAYQKRLPVVSEKTYNEKEWLVENFNRFDKYDRRDAKVMIAGFSANENTLKGALSEAAFLTSLERNSDMVSMAAFAQTIAGVGEAEEQAPLIKFDAKDIYLTPNYYALQLFSNNQGKEYVNMVVLLGAADKGISATAVKDEETGELVIKMINTEDRDASLHIDLRREYVDFTTANQILLEGEDSMGRTIKELENVVPRVRKINIGTHNFMYDVRANSFSILRFSPDKSL